MDNESNILQKIYFILLDEFGPRNWWPSDSKFETIIGAILTQNVSWSNARLAIDNLKDNGFLEMNVLHDMDEGEIAGLIKSSRFYNQKAKKIKIIVDFLIQNYNGDIESLSSENMFTLRKNLLNLWGFGEETVDSILLYACNMPIFVVDAYTERIFNRIGLIDNDLSYSQIQEFFMKNLPRTIELYNDYHAQIVLFGNTLCKKVPDCHNCPLKEIKAPYLCNYYFKIFQER